MISQRLTILALVAATAAAACVVRGNVPDLEQDTLCVPGYEERIPSFCDWAQSTDAIVVGKLTGLRWALSHPMSLATGADAPEGCEPISGVLELQLDVTAALHGPIRAGERIVLLGQDASTWRPKPIASDPDRSVVQWWPPELPGLVVGQLLGVALHRQPSGEKWGTYMEPLFTEDEGRLRASKSAGLCDLAAPIATGDFASVTELGQAIDACPAATAAAAERRAAINAGDAAWRAICHDRAPAVGDDESGT